MAIVREYHRPQTAAEAVGLLQNYGDRAALLAGGSQLVVDLETRARPEVEAVIDLAGLGLDAIEEGAGRLRLGATATLAAVMEHPAAQQLAGGLLVRAARGEGPVNLRNAATVGGVVAAAEHDSEFYAALLALGASVVTSDGAQETVTPLEDLGEVTGLITAVLLPLAEARGGHARVARTPSDRPIVAALVVRTASVERVALCGVAARPVLLGAPLDPPDDFKGSADYRRALAEVVVARARENAFKG
jgi:CO/xanthine dehydrogenase FAD-binding subunit